MSDRDDFELAYIETLGDERFAGLEGFLASSRVSEDAYMFNNTMLDTVQNMVATGCINAAWWAWRYQAGRYDIMQRGVGNVLH